MRNTRLLLSAAVAAAIAAPAAAETASTTLDVTVALQPALTVTCTAADFGVLRVRTGSRGGNSNIEINADGVRTTTVFNQGAISFGAAGASGPRCTMTGSSAADGANANISFDSDFPTLTGATLGEIAAPTTAAAVEVAGSTFGTAEISGGSATFDITIEIRIPDNLTADNYGGYSFSRQVTVNDGV